MPTAPPQIMPTAPRQCFADTLRGIRDTYSEVTARSEHTDHRTDINSTRFLHNMVTSCCGKMEPEFDPHVALMATVVNAFRRGAGFIRRTPGRHTKVLGAGTTRLDMSITERKRLTSKEHKMQNQALLGTLAGLCLRRGWGESEMCGMFGRSAKRIMRLGAAKSKKPSSGTTELYRDKGAGAARNQVFNMAWDEVAPFKGASERAVALCMADALLSGDNLVSGDSISVEICGMHGIKDVVVIEAEAPAPAGAPEEGADDLDFAFD